MLDIVGFSFFEIGKYNMSLWLQKRYANLVSPKLELFKWKKPTLANFRCPYCGDSQKNKRKTRGYLYSKSNEFFYKCHNCPASTNFSNFLKHVDVNLHVEYTREVFADKYGHHKEKQTEVVIEKKEQQEGKSFDFEKLTLAKLPDEHFAKQYIVGRKIPVKYFDEMLYVENMNSFAKEFIDKNSESPADPCIIILVKDQDSKVIGVNGRSLKPENKFAKYIKAKVSEDVKLIYGLHRLDKNKKVYVFEGEFDSMFLPNAIAVGGVGMMRGIENIIGVNKELVVQVVDNDPRNREVVKVIEKLIEDGYAVTILPGDIEGKDVNDLVKDDKYDPKQVQELIDRNTFSGLTAKLNLNSWKKC